MKNYILLISLAIVLIAFFMSFEFIVSIKVTVITFIQTLFSGNIPKIKVFSKEELKQYKGNDGGEVYLAIIGSVFDVSRGRRHYGQGGGYEFFSGIDGSRAFVTGKFDEEGLIDDISDLSNSEILSLDGWKSFYEKDYLFVGVVEGSFYDKAGRHKEMMKTYRRKLSLALKEKTLMETDRQLFPPCNSEWSQEGGSRVWCSKLSGGIKRDWEGVPRMYFTAGKSKPRCACIRQFGPPSHDMTSENHGNNGDLDNPHLNQYPGCESSSKSCTLVD